MSPLGERGGSAILECLPFEEGALRREVIVDRAVQRGESLRTLRPREVEHYPFTPSDMQHGCNTAPADLCRKYRPEPVPKEQNRLMRDVD